MLLFFQGLIGSVRANVHETVSQARSFREKGDFKEAAAVLNDTLAKSRAKISDEERKRLTYEIDLLERIRQDFPHTKEALFEKIKAGVRDVTPAEFESWLKEGRFESRVIDGTEYFSGTSVSNLFWRDSNLESRRRTPKDRSAFHRAMLENCRAVTRAAAVEKKPYVLPHHYEIKMTVTAEENAAPENKIIRAWLPVPRKYPFQDGLKILSSSSPVKYLADENSPIRSAHFEQTAQKNQKTRFQITYEYSTHAIRFDLDPEKCTSLDALDEKTKVFTREAPHVVFTDKLKALAAKIVGQETNPVRKARAIYDWIGANLKYSYALEYSTLPNISDYCLTNNYGDCGQQALLFITLCRQQGIPARWQSGWIIFPGGKNIHDWTEIYLAPWGWVPVDPEVGGAILRYAFSLTKEERKEIHDFYFGGLDQYRLIANSDHSQELQPPKKTFRSDDVDFQRGELESGDTNIYFDKYSYGLEFKTIEKE